jgi:hydroxypyruvate reductase
MDIVTNDLAAAARSIFAAALEECRIEHAFASGAPSGTADNPFAFSLSNLNEASVEVDLSGVTRILVIAAGKGAATMLQGLQRCLPLPSGCSLQGVLIAPEPPAILSEGFQYFAGGHPLPNQESFAGAKAALSLVEQAAHSGVFCFFLISGGASAMMELPLDASISLEDTVAFHRALVHSGASIAEINCVRKHFSAVKGGRLGHAAARIPNLTVLVSDVPSGHLDALASGPTVPDSSTVQECHEILQRYALLNQFPPAVSAFFNSAALPETPKKRDFSARVITLLSDAELAEAACRKAEALGFSVFPDHSCDDWDYRDAAVYLVDRLRKLRKRYKCVCVVSSGEVTVQVSGHSGIGGRNQQFALYAATLLKPSDHPAAVFSAGSDGIDGNSTFAGAVLDDQSLRADGVTAEDVQSALLQFNSAPLLDRLHATVLTGPTGNNLRDLRLLLCE